MAGLHHALQEFDGKRTAVLEAIRDAVEPGEAVLREAIEFAAHDDSAIASGATWLLRAWIEAGARCGARLVGRLAKVLPRITDPWAALHVCQTVRSLEVPRAHAADFVDFLELWRRSKRPFARAWALDGLARLAAAHPEHAGRAAQALAEGLDDPAASVRARARRAAEGK